MARKAKYRLLPDLGALVVGVALLAGVNLLPPDTSLETIQQSGVLRACVPQSYPPLVTGTAASPGFDIGLLQEIATRLRLRLSLNVVPAMGRDFNPRNWRITRALCDVVAGGVTTSDLTRSLLDTLSTGIENSWVQIGPAGTEIGQGTKVGVFPGFSGLDRTGLSTYLRSRGAQLKLAASPQVLEAGLADHSIDVAVTGKLDSEPIIKALPGMSASELPAELGRYAFGLGLWKGDLTFKRAVVDLYGQLQREGVIARLRGQYGLPPVASAS